MVGTVKKQKSISHLRDLKHDPKNARKHNPRNIGMIEKSLNEVGAARSIVIDENGVVLAGNGLIDAAAQAGIEKVKVVEASGEEIIAVRRTGLTAKQKKRLALYDNRASELSEWDADVIADIAKSEKDLLEGMFDERELNNVLRNATADAAIEDAEPQIDRAAELQKKWNTTRGQIWKLGEHRLMCGDSTSKEDVEKLMGGEMAELTVTSPPYWIGKEYENQKTNEQIDRFVSCVSDLMSSVTTRRIVINVAAARRHLAVGGNVETRLNLDDWQNELRSQGWLLRFVRCWSKSGALSGTAAIADTIDQNWEFVAVFYNPKFKKTGQNSVGESWAMSGVWSDIQKTEQKEHSAPFNIAIPSRNIELYTNDSGVVFEPFSGSGTTIMACEKLNRKCRAMELEPKYVAVALERWSMATGKTPELIENGTSKKQKKHS